MNILLGVTGSVAAKLTPILAETLRKSHAVKMVVTKHSLHFWEPYYRHDLGAVHSEQIIKDHHEWPEERKYQKGDKVLHIELRKWADLLLIAPLSANTLAKMANGLADNVLTSVIRAWDYHKPLIVAPAMNTMMWEHPATAEHLERLRRWFPKLQVIQPVSKLLACGDEGLGAMAPVEVIVDAVDKVK